MDLPALAVGRPEIEVLVCESLADEYAMAMPSDLSAPIGSLAM